MNGCYCITRNIRLLILVLFVAGSGFSLTAWNFFTPDSTPVQPYIPQPSLPFFTLLINPAGDAKNAGREIDGTYERGITMQCATELKKALEQRIPGIRVVLTRFPGEVVQPLQNASFANRLKIDLYLSIHFFEHTEKILPLYFYHLLYNPIIDRWDKAGSELEFLPYDKAYTLSIKKTVAYGTDLFQHAKKIEGTYGVRCHPLKGIPFKPLVGIIAPAVALECGIRKKDDWRPLIPLFVAMLEPLVTKMRSS